MNYAAIMINDFDLLVNLGWTDTERSEKQSVKLNIELHCEKIPTACDSDQLDDTNCYDSLIKRVTDFVADKEFRLIEHLAKSLHTLIKSSTDYKAVIIHVTKYPPIKDFTGNVRFSYGG